MNKKLPFNPLLALVVFIVGGFLAWGFLQLRKKPGIKLPSDLAPEAQITVLPTKVPNNTPTPGDPRLENPTEDYKEELKKNREEQGITEISITTDGFSPKSTSIKKGIVITWTNNLATSCEIVGDSTKWGSYRAIEPGKKFSHQFDVPGTYTYQCKDQDGQTGSITVTD